MRLNRQSGFTLMEMLVVLGIMTMLAPMVYPELRERVLESRGDTSIAETMIIANAASAYRQDTGSWPGGAGCGSAISTLLGGGTPYISDVDATNIFGYTITTSCTSNLFRITQRTSSTLGDYIAQGLPATSVTSSSTGTIRTSISKPGAEPALNALLPRDGSRAMTGNLNMGSRNITNATDIYASRFRDRENSSYYVDPASTSVLNDARANIFRDRNNTAYYGDFASRSRLNYLDARSMRDMDNTFYQWDGTGTTRQNYTETNRFRLRYSSSVGAGCTTGSVGRTSAGEGLFCVSGRWQKPGGSVVKVRTGSVSTGGYIAPISGYSRSQCSLSVSGVPRKNDGGYKRSRHYSHWWSASGGGWRAYAGHRSISDNSLTQVPSTIQYSMVCTK